MSETGWGEAETKFFFELTPDHVLEAVEASGIRLNGRCIPLNSYENRVYELELETDEESKTASERVANRRVAKFYRPGRWNRDQILEEHAFLLDLAREEVPVVAPISFSNGETLHETAHGNLFYTLFPKVGGRAFDELTKDQLQQLGRLLGRIHNVGATKKTQHRIHLNAQTYGVSNLEYLLENKWIPWNLMDRYEKAAREIFRRGESMFASATSIRLHGDCHMGNLLWQNEQACFLDFDDMISGPAVQDFWLLIAEENMIESERLETLLSGYEKMRAFDRSSLPLIEILRALRFVHYTAWLARRWKDPIFPASFPFFNTRQYWEEKTYDLEEQLTKIGSAACS